MTTDKPIPRRASRKPRKSLYEEYITPKLIKDTKFFIAGLTVMTIHIFHYLSIMKYWMTHPRVSKYTLVFHFAIFIVDVIILYYLYLFKLYPILYAEEIAAEKLDQERMKREHDEQMELRRSKKAE
ncbi:hypothetical protein SBY92_001188 [Candida maltosa Xu316]|uniref:Uncharacterized protein n=1 Tax=Candida maltosa (strain Xu316) TaxID=1245528 RepID=M3JT82_CANMX|nr:hypothetical protein G210_3691 [Candida maltosa Xu316]